MPESIDEESIMEKITAAGKKNLHLLDKESVSKVVDKWIKIPSDKLYNYIFDKRYKALSTSVKNSTVAPEAVQNVSSEVLTPLEYCGTENSVVTGLKTSWNVFNDFSKSLVGYSVSASKGLFNGTISIFRGPKEAVNSVIASTSSLYHKLIDRDFYSDLFSSNTLKKNDISGASSLASSTIISTATFSDDKLSESLLLTGKNSYFSASPPFIKKSVKLLKGYSDNALYSFNNNKFLISSFFLAGLAINEIGVKYHKSQLNKQWNVLTYKEMNIKVVLVLGSMLDPITKVEVEDLLSRGFIVYVASGDVKNSPFSEELSEMKKSVNVSKKDSELDDYFDKQNKKSGDILSDSTSEEEEEQALATNGKKISDSDWIISSTECFSNVYASEQDFTRLNYISTSRKDLSKLGKEIKDKKWELVSIILSHDNISNNIKTSTDHFKDLILNNIMDLVASLYSSISIWPDAKIILFNNSLSKINERCAHLEKKCNEPSLEILCNNMVETVYDTLFQSSYSNAYLVEIGLLKDVNNKYLNYQSLHSKLTELETTKNAKTSSSSIYREFLNPVQNLIMNKNTSSLFYDASEKNILYCGSLSSLNRNLANHLTNIWVLNFILLKQKICTFSYTLFLKISNIWFTAFVNLNNYISLTKKWVIDKSKIVLEQKKKNKTN